MSYEYHNLLILDPHYRDVAREMIQTRLPNYSEEHSRDLCGGKPTEYMSRCVTSLPIVSGHCPSPVPVLVGVMAFRVRKLDTVEIVAFVSASDGKGIGRFLMESFLSEMNSKSAILTYVEPAALKFFEKFGFTSKVPARSLYERIINKYISATLMYRNLLTVLDVNDARRTSGCGSLVNEGDRIMVLVDGTMQPRQAVIKKLNSVAGSALVHYIFWNTRHDEWIFLHSPRIRWDVPTPSEPPKSSSENTITSDQVLQVNIKEFELEKKLYLIESVGAWPQEFKINANVQVLVEGSWVDAVVIGKTKEFLYCKFEFKGHEWNQDFPRDGVRMPDTLKTALDVLVERNAQWRAKRYRNDSSNGDDSDMHRKEKPTRKKRHTEKVKIEISPLKERADGAVTALDATSVSSEILSPMNGFSNRTLRKLKRDELLHVRVNGSVKSRNNTSQPMNVPTSPMTTSGTCASSPSLNGDDVSPCMGVDLKMETDPSYTCCSLCCVNTNDKQNYVLKCVSCGISVHPECYLINMTKFIKPLPNVWCCDPCVFGSLARAKKRLCPACVYCGKSRSESDAPMIQTMAYKWIHLPCARMNGLQFHPSERRFANIKSPSPLKSQKPPTADVLGT